MLPQTWQPGAILVALVAAILWAGRRKSLQPLFKWLPMPLWCYAVPLVLRSIGWLPAEHPSYQWLTDVLLPLSLALLLLGLQLQTVLRSGSRAVAAMAVGSCGIMVGATGMWWLCRRWLPAEAWKGVGILSATWTGGSLNMLAVRSILDVSDAVFAPLVVVDAMMAYGWMACLLALRPASASIDRWLRASSTARSADDSTTRESSGSIGWSTQCGVFALALVLMLGSRALAARLPTGSLVANRSGWTILLVSTLSLLISAAPSFRTLGQPGASVGYPCLYLVLATLGARANLAALFGTPVWIIVGVGTVLTHAIALLVAGRLFRWPMSLLATSSQANVGGVVSAPLVAALYESELAPVGLMLALLGNALGTYIGLGAAALCLRLVK